MPGVVTSREASELRSREQASSGVRLSSPSETSEPPLRFVRSLRGGKNRENSRPVSDRGVLTGVGLFDVPVDLASPHLPSERRGGIGSPPFRDREAPMGNE